MVRYIHIYFNHYWYSMKYTLSGTSVQASSFMAFQCTWKLTWIPKHTFWHFSLSMTLLGTPKFAFYIDMLRMQLATPNISLGAHVLKLLSHSRQVLIYFSSGLDSTLLRHLCCPYISYFMALPQLYQMTTSHGSRYIYCKTVGNYVSIDSSGQVNFCKTFMLSSAIFHSFVSSVSTIFI